MHASPYTGRFAPTPSGHLHFGSLLAALASYLDARKHHGRWLIRIEDLDRPRCIAGASEQILATLAAYGLHPDDTTLFQSQRLDRYQAVIEHWLESGHAYYCDCSRRDIAEHGGVYPGTCSQRNLPARADRAIRLRVPEQPISFTDRLQGRLSQNLASETGDIIIRRRDGIIAYQLAVVVDDIEQDITDIVRGADLLDSTPRQLWMYQLLGADRPRYMHIPLVMREDGEKLSKRLGSTPLDPASAPATLFRAITALAQQPPATLRDAPVEEQLEWAIANWQPERLPGRLQLLESDLNLS